MSNMENIKMKMVSRKIKRMLLPLLGMMWFSSAYSAMTVRIGDRVETSQGNSITITTEIPNEKVSICIDGLSFEYSGPNYWSVDDSQAQFKTSAWDWIDNGCLAAPEHKVGTFSFFADYDNKVILVKAGGADGYISVDNKVACRRTGVTLHADNLVAGDNLRWAKVNAPGDTLWLTEYDDVVEFSDNLDVVKESVTFYNRIFREQTRIDTIVDELGDSTFNTVKYDMFVAENSIVIPITLQGCGYTLTADNPSACVSESITLTCSFLGAGSYRWLNTTTGEEEITSVNTLTVRPKGNETYQVYADGMLVSSIDLTPKSMVDCGFTLTADKELLCLGKETVLSSNFDKASKYEWYVDGVLLETTDTPTLTVAPKVNSTYVLYADGFLVDSVEVLVEKCTFFIASRYPLVSCLQDSNILMAAGTAVLEDLNNNVFEWSRRRLDSLGTPIEDWKAMNERSYRLSVLIDTAYSWEYRVRYSGYDTTIVYDSPECKSNAFCDGLEAKTLFYETFGYFMSENVYVNNYNVYVNQIEKDYRTSITDGTTTYYPSAQYDPLNEYYTITEGTPLTISVDHASSMKLDIRNFVTPDPNGYVVVPRSNYFVSPEDANKYVAFDGHLFLSENPMLGHYDSWSTMQDGGLRLQDGYYAIVMNPDTCDQNTGAGDDFVSVKDATGNANGAMLFVNSGSMPGAAIYAQQVDICPDSLFTMGMDVMNAMAKQGGNPVNLTVLLLKEFNEQYQVSGDALANVDNVLYQFNTGDISSGTGIWTRFDQFIELSAKEGKFWVVIYNNGPSGSGNDILIDDITFSVCVPKVIMNVYDSSGELLGSDVVSCEPDSLSLVAKRRTPAKNSYFLFQLEEEGKWVDMQEYTEDSEQIAKGVDALDTVSTDPLIEIPIIKNVFKISTTDPKYAGQIKYRVVTGDNYADVLKYSKMSKEEIEQEKEQTLKCALSNNISESIITIKNTFGGDVGEILNFEGCDSVNSVITAKAVRGTIPDDIEWLSSWVDANGVAMFKPSYDEATNRMQPILTGLKDSIDIKILNTKDSIVQVTYKGQSIEKKYNEVEHMKFIYYYEGGDSTSILDDCDHTVEVNVKFKTLLEISTSHVDTAKGCNQVDVKVTRNLSFAPFSFQWFDSNGNEIVESDLYHFDYNLDPNGLDSVVTLVVNKDSLSKISMFEGYVLASPLSPNGGDYCINELSELKIPFQVHNGYYQLGITPSVSPVCISDLSEPDGVALVLKAVLKGFNGTSLEGEKIMAKLNKFKWSIQFSDKDGKPTVTFDTMTLTPECIFTNASLREYTSQTMSVSIASTFTEVCAELNQDAAVSSLDVPIREGGLKLDLDVQETVCLLSETELTLKASVLPKQSLVNILERGFDWIMNGEVIKDSFEINPDVTEYELKLTKDQYPDLFRAGNTSTFKILTYDEKCESNAVSEDKIVKLNGTGVSITTPEINCLSQGDEYLVEAVLDSANAENLLTNVQWLINGVEVQSNSKDLRYTFNVSEAAPNTKFEVIVEDGICTSNYSANLTKDINIKYTVNLNATKNSICSVGDSAWASVVITPSASRKLIKKYTWYAIKDGETNAILVDTKDNGSLNDSLLITSTDYPSLFSAGGSFDLYVVAEDGICDAVQSDNTLDFDVNTPFTVSLEPSGNTYCIDPAVPVEVSLTAVVTPAEAANHIQQYQWTRNSSPKLIALTNINKFNLSDKWLSPGYNNQFGLVVTDGICAIDSVKATTNISLNYKKESRVDLDIEYRVPNRDTICSQKDFIILSWNVDTSDDSTSTIPYDVQLFYDRKDSIGYVPLSNNIVTTSELNLNSYKPGDSLYFRIEVDDNICSTISLEVGTVVLKPFTASVQVSDDTICEGEQVEFKLTNFVPKESEQFVKYYSWYQSDGLFGDNYVPIIGSDNVPYKPIGLKAGSYNVLSFVSDGICFGVPMVGDPEGVVYSYQTDPEDLKVNAPIQVDLIPSADVYCEGQTPEPVTFAASVTQGEPIRYVWYNSKNEILRDVNTTSTTDFITFEPTVDDSKVTVEVFDGVCNTTGTAANNAYSVSVYQPFILDIASSSYEICLGDSVTLGVGVIQGKYNKLDWYSGRLGDVLSVNKQEPIYSVAYPQAPGDVYFSAVASNGVCEDDTVVVGPIDVHEPISVQLSANVENVTIGAEVLFTANVLSGNPLSFEWMDNDVSIGTSLINTHQYEPKSSSEYKVYAGDGVCPVAFSTIELGVVLPTAFTPHFKDGLNDVYMEGYYVIIFDRYGQKVFEGGNGWDGTHRGVLADPGVYYSKVKLNNGKVVSGTIEIVKYD